MSFGFSCIDNAAMFQTMSAHTGISDRSIIGSLLTSVRDHSGHRRSNNVSGGRYIQEPVIRVMRALLEYGYTKVPSTPILSLRVASFRSFAEMAQAVVYIHSLPQFIPNSTPTSVQAQMPAFHQRTEVLLQRIAAAAGQPDRIGHRHPAMLPCKLDDLQG